MCIHFQWQLYDCIPLNRHFILCKLFINKANFKIAVSLMRKIYSWIIHQMLIYYITTCFKVIGEILLYISAAMSFDYLVLKLFFLTFPPKFRCKNVLDLTEPSSKVCPTPGPALRSQAPDSFQHLVGPCGSKLQTHTHAPRQQASMVGPSDRLAPL